MKDDFNRYKTYLSKLVKDLDRLVGSQLHGTEMEFEDMLATYLYFKYVVTVRNPKFGCAVNRAGRIFIGLDLDKTEFIVTKARMFDSGYSVYDVSQFKKYTNASIPDDFIQSLSNESSVDLAFRQSAYFKVITDYCENLVGTKAFAELAPNYYNGVEGSRILPIFLMNFSDNTIEYYSDIDVQTSNYKRDTHFIINNSSLGADIDLKRVQKAVKDVRIVTHRESSKWIVPLNFLKLSWEYSDSPLKVKVSSTEIQKRFIN